MNSQQSKTNCPIKVVSFSHTSLMTIVDYPTPDEKKAMWYSNEDLETFKHDLHRDVGKCYKILDVTNFHMLSKDDFLHFIGLESFIAQGLIRQICVMKKVHRCRILIEQARQRNFNVYSFEELARVSAIGSIWSRRRSHAIAVEHMNISV